MKIVNKSGLYPKGQAVLCLPYEPELKKSILAIPETARERSMMVEVRAIVIEIGAEAWGDEKEPRAQVGDKVLISKFAGAICTGPRDNKKYRMVNGRDIYCVIDDGEEVEKWLL